ncbi:hypothetical protein tb265_42690 [Gemmatimonadetes bacterium T265]|nr:hypothetical protein tb265_42690 [Gemmatimonadetes bacterium T265]
MTAHAPASPAGWPHLPAEVAFVTGMLDLIGWFLLTGFFSANTTGDAVESASYVVPGQHPHVLQLLAVPLFVVAVVLVYLLSRRFGSASAATVRAMRAIQFVLLACLCLVSGTMRPSASPGGLEHVLVGVLAVVTVAVSDTAMHMLDATAPTTWAITANVVTGMIALLNVATKYGSPAEWAEDLAARRDATRRKVAPAHGMPNARRCGDQGGGRIREQ